MIVFSITIILNYQSASLEYFPMVKVVFSYRTLVERSQDFKEKSWVLMNTP